MSTLPSSGKLIWPASEIARLDRQVGVLEHRDPDDIARAENWLGLARCGAWRRAGLREGATERERQQQESQAER